MHESANGFVRDPCLHASVLQPPSGPHELQKLLCWRIAVSSNPRRGLDQVWGLGQSRLKTGFQDDSRDVDKATLVVPFDARRHDQGLHVPRQTVLPGTSVAPRRSTRRSPFKPHLRHYYRRQVGPSIVLLMDPTPIPFVRRLRRPRMVEPSSQRFIWHAFPAESYVDFPGKVVLPAKRPFVEAHYVVTLDRRGLARRSIDASTAGACRFALSITAAARWFRRRWSGTAPQ